MALWGVGHESEVFTLTSGPRNTTDFLGVRVERVPLDALASLQRLGGRLGFPATARSVAGARALAGALEELQANAPNGQSSEPSRVGSTLFRSDEGPEQGAQGRRPAPAP